MTAGRRRNPLARPAERLLPLAPVRHDELRGRGWRRGADVRGEVGERDVDLVADAADHGHAVGDDRPDDALVVERPQVLEAAAAAGEDRHLRGVVGSPFALALLDPALQAAERGDDARRRLFALDLAGDEHDLGQRPAASEDVADVAPDDPRRAGDDRDRGRARR